MSTIKQRKAFNKVMKSDGISVSKAMVDVGYSPATANRPAVLTRSKGWEELMEKHLPDKLLSKKHREGLEATIKKPYLVDRDDKGRPIYEYISEEDFSTRHKYLDSAYKLKGRYKDEEGSKNWNVIIDKMRVELKQFLNV